MRNRGLVAAIAIARVEVTCAGERQIIDAKSTAPQIVAAALTFATPRPPPKTDLAQGRAAEQRRAHAHVASHLKRAALAKIVRRQSAEGGTMLQLVPKSANATRRQRDVVVQEHHPVRTT